MRLVGFAVGLLMTAVGVSPATAQEVFATSFFGPTGLEGDSNLSGVLRINLSTGAATTFIPEVAGGLTQPTDVVYDESSNTLYVASLAGQVWHYDATTGAPRASLIPGAPAGTFTAFPPVEVAPNVVLQPGASALAIDGGDLLIGSSFGGVIPFDLTTGAPSDPLGNPQLLPFPSAISPARSGELFITTSDPQSPLNPGELFDLTASTTTPIVNANAVLGFNSAASATVVAPQGDYDQDGIVDNDDFDAWLADFGTVAERSDGNGDGLVDAADYTIWRDTFGEESRVIVSDPAGNRLIDYALDGTDGRVLATIPPIDPVPENPLAPVSNFPSEVLVTPSGTLLVSVQGVNQRGANNRGALLEYSRDGTLLRTIASDLTPIAGLAFAPAAPLGFSVPEPATALLLAVLGLAAPSRRG